MNFDLELFEKTEAKEMGEREVLELGGHELIIMDAGEYTSEFTGNTSLKVCVDIGGKDKQVGFFKRQFEANNNEGKKWSNGATKYVSLKDEQIAYLKGFITSVEKSNPSFKFNPKGTWDQLKGLKIAGQFGLEEFKDNDGKIRTTTKLVQFRSLDKLDEISIPRVKRIDGSFIDYDDYEELKHEENNQPNEIEIPDDALPF